jgi:type IV pilus assembly protein PilM
VPVNGIATRQKGEFDMPETIGLDIGSHSIKLVGLKMTSKGPFLTHAGIKEIPYGSDKENVNTVSEILRTLVSEVGLKTKKVSLTVSGSGVNIQRITIPSMPKAELKEAVPWEIKGNLPSPIETAQIDFHILDEFVEDSVKKLDLIVVACPNHLIERTLSIAKGAGLQPTHLDVGPFALWNALLVWERSKKGEGIALIDLGSEKTGIHLFKDGILQFSREVTPAGADITRAIIEGLGFEGEPELLYERAERIKQEVGIPSEADQEGIVDDSINISKISFLIRPVLERLTAEIQRSLDYYKSQFNVERIDRVLLTGGGANLKNIASYLGGELRLPVEPFNPLREILFDSKKIDVQVLNQMGSLFTVATGIAFPEPKRIELLPAKEPLISRVQMGKLIPIIAPIIAILVFLWIIWDMNGQETIIKKERAEKMAKVTSIETLQAKLKLLKGKEEKIKQKLSLFPSSAIVSVPYPAVLSEISRIVPDNVALKLVSVQYKGKLLKKGPQTPKPQEEESQRDDGTELHLTGLAFGSDVHCLTSLSQIIERLERSPLFKNAKLVSAEENKLYNQPGGEFEIVCDIAPDDQKREEKP